MRMEKSVVIARPVEDVWAVLSNLDNVKRWSTTGSEFRQTSPGPLGVGASVEIDRAVLGRFHIRLQDVVVTGYEPNRTLAMTIPNGIAQQPIAERFTLEPSKEGTRITRVAEMDLKRGIRPFEGMLASLLGWGWGRDLANLKRLVEASTQVNRPG